jgi:hypothetical protein
LTSAGRHAAFFVLLAAALVGPAVSSQAALPDERGWEMVSPLDKNGGQVDRPGALSGGGALQAAADGDSVTYGSAASFGAGAEGAPPASQYISRRDAGGWSTENVSAPLYSGSYGVEPEGVPYRLFSGDLARALMLNGHHCRGEAQGCAVANPPLAGTDAPVGYQNYYLRDGATGAFGALLGLSDVAGLALEPADFELTLAGASPDLRHVVLSTCAALTAEAVEVPLGEGCDPEEQNLYSWSAGAGLSLVNLAPGDAVGTPGAAIAAPAGAVSADGARVYWNDTATGNLFLREGAQSKQVDTAAGGGGTLETAAADGGTAIYTKAGHLWSYDAETESSADLTPSGGVVGALGASIDATRVYYLTGSGLFLWQAGDTTEVADAADASNYPPAVGTARVGADGAHLAFVSTSPLTAYDNTEAAPKACGDPGVSGERCAEVYLYDAEADLLRCASCKAKGRPTGPSTLPGATANGEGPAATRSYKPRALSSGGGRLFFDSRDNLASTDTNADWDVYQWEVNGLGSCEKAPGCLALISSGRSEGGASFVDASSQGEDVFFLTDGSLVGSDPGSVDLYDARVGGGFPEPEAPIACEGNACQSLPPEPTDPPLGTTLAGLGNPPVRYSGRRKPCRKGKVRRGGECVKGKRGKRRSGEARGRRGRAWQGRAR